MVIGPIKKIGIALAAYQPNVAFFAEQLGSIQGQSFKNWTCVVSFDSPTEHVLSEPSIKRFTEDQRFRFLENPIRLGHKKNFERSLKEILRFKVNAVAFSDQDDVWYPGKLEECAKELEKQPAYSLVHSDMHILYGDRLSEKTAWQIERRGVRNVAVHHLIIRNVVAGCSILMDANLAEKFPLVPEGVDFHDHWYALVAASLGTVHPIFKPLYAYRQHQENVVAVSPFQGRFWIKPGLNFFQVVKKMKLGFYKSRSVWIAMRSQKIKTSARTFLFYGSNLDCGLGILILGIRHVVSDPPLFRACIARGFGKIFSCLGG